MVIYRSPQAFRQREAPLIVFWFQGGVVTCVRVVSNAMERMKVMQGLALVDFHNYMSPKTSRTGLQSTAEELVKTVVATFSDWQPQIREIDLRLYGGWIDEAGDTSPDASVLLPFIPYLNGRYNGIVVRLSLATTMLVQPEFTLSGTVRLQVRRHRQKMVDQMIGCDAIFMTGDSVLVAVFSDDDDMIPPLVMAHSIKPGSTLWVRRTTTKRPNDKLLKTLQLSVTNGGQYVG